MFRSTRYFGKNDGKHNLFGEIEYVEDWSSGGEEEDVIREPVPPDPQEEDEE